MAKRIWVKDIGQEAPESTRRVVSHWRAKAGKGRNSILKRIVIMKRSFIDSREAYLLRECLKIMFPESDIEIRSNPLLSIPDEDIRMKPDQNRIAL